MGFNSGFKGLTIPTRCKKFGTKIVYKHNYNSAVANSAKMQIFEARSDKFNEYKFLFGVDVFAAAAAATATTIIIIII